MLCYGLQPLNSFNVRKSWHRIRDTRLVGNASWGEGGGGGGSAESGLLLRGLA